MISAHGLLRIASGTSGILIGLYLAGLSNRGVHVGAGLVGTLSAVSFAAELFASVPAGIASDRLQRRLLMAGGAVLGAFAAVLFAISGSTSIFFLSRTLEGIGAAAIVPALLAYLADATEGRPALRVRAMSYFELTLLAGLALGGILAAQLFRAVHAGAFYVVALAYLACAAILFRSVSDTRGRNIAHPIADLLRVLRLPSIGHLAPVWLCVNAVVGLWLGPTLPFLLTQRSVTTQYLAGLFAADPARVGWMLFGYAMVFGAGVTAWSFVLPHVRLRPALWIAVGAMLPACAAIYLLNHSAHQPASARWVIGGILALIVMVESGFTPAALAWLAGGLPLQSGRGAAMGIYSVLLSVGAIIGSLLAALLGQLYSIDGLLFGTVLVAGLALVLIRWIPNPRPLSLEANALSGNPYDLAIIGAGSAGLIAADFARKLGARVILLERERIGGDCTWTGCVPSKSLLKVARVAHEMRTAARFGVQSHEPIVNMVEVRDYLRSTIDRIYEGTTPDALRLKNIDVRFGAVRFVDPHNLAVGDERVRAKKILIATGAHPTIPPLPGLDDVAYSTYQNIFENDHLPGSMAVIGGGPVGVEVAQAYQRLGVRVTIFAERLLPKEEPEASGIVRSVLQREGLQAVAERALSVARNGKQISVRSQHGQTDCDLLFVAAGRRPTLDGLNLEAAGVTYSERGIKTNDRLQTSTKHIFAAGDVLGGQQFSHYAGWQGFQAARNALLPGSASGVAADVPRVTFTDPEVAQVGRTEAEARAARRNDVVVTSWPIDREDRAVCDDDRDGLLKLITTRDGAILGATVVARRAGDVITELILAMRHKLKVNHLAGTIHPYPTYSTGIQLLATEVAVDHVLNGLPGKLIRAASRLAR